MLHSYKLYNKTLGEIDNSKILISTINAHSYNTTLRDKEFKEALENSDILLPDGIGVVWANHLLTGRKIKKIAGDDLFHYQMNRLNNSSGKCFFLGSNTETLKRITERAAIDYPKVRISTYSPPYKSYFSDEENQIMVNHVNAFTPDVLFVGMTAPKQEKWAFVNFNELKVGHVCCIGAVFDFYAGTSKRAPKWMINIGIEWFYRLIKNPRKMWRRYLIGNIIFVSAIFKEKIMLKTGLFKTQN